MESYQRLIDIIAIENLQMRLEHWTADPGAGAPTLAQAAAIVAGLVLARLLARPVRRRLAAFAARPGLTVPACAARRRRLLDRPRRVALVLLAVATGSPATSAGRTCC